MVENHGRFFIVVVILKHFGKIISHYIMFNVLKSEVSCPYKILWKVQSGPYESVSTIDSGWYGLSGSRIFNGVEWGAGQSLFQIKIISNRNSQ